MDDLLADDWHNEFDAICERWQAQNNLAHAGLQGGDRNICNML